jgi:hypothetical protein
MTAVIHRYLSDSILPGAIKFMKRIRDLMLTRYSSSFIGAAISAKLLAFLTFRRTTK